MKKQLFFLLAVVFTMMALLTACNPFKGPQEEPPVDEHVCVAGKWLINKYPTDTEEGVEQKVCVECGAVLEEKALAGSQGLAYALVGNTYEVTGIGTCTDSDIVIPRTYNGLPVSAVNEGAFNGYTAIVSLVLGDRITTIEANAFRNCTSLTKVTLSESVSNIADGAFNGCTLLDDVYYNGDLMGWLNIEFKGATANPMNNGTNLYIAGELVENLRIPDNVIIIPPYSFVNCKSIKTLDVHDSVRAIDAHAFENCAELVTVQLGNEVNSIATYAFSNCTKIKEVVIPDNVRIIGAYAFNKCTSVESFTCGKSVMSIGESALQDCTTLRTLNINEGTQVINNNAFNNCINVEKVNYNGTADTWVSIKFMNASANPMQLNKAKAFFNGQSVEHVVINEATYINAYAFYKCSSLRSVTLGDNVTHIDDYAFYDCNSLTKAELNCTIDPYAFAECDYLSSVTAGVKMTSIGNNAFQNDKYLTSFTYAGAQSEWDAMTKGSNWNSGVHTNFKVTCTGIEPEVDTEAE